MILGFIFKNLLFFVNIVYSVIKDLLVNVEIFLMDIFI